MKNNICMSADGKYCSGCGACAAVCPADAIDIKLNSAGFYEAKAVDDKCIGCGICKNVCSKFNSMTGIDLYEAEHYAVQSVDACVVKNSSSGGAAHELAEYAVEAGKTVVGCIYDANDGRARHICVDDKAGLDLLKGSKYLQSDTKTAFSEVIKAAASDDNKQFVVFGTPCQIAGIDRASKQKKIRSRFLLVEIFCHGVSSYRIWDKQLEKINKSIKGSPENVQFRYKKDDWHSYCIKATKGNRSWYGTREKAEFWHVFFENVLLNDACMVCEARREISAADIRLGDYWGYRFESHSDGVSAVFAMTDAGKTAVKELIASGRIKLLEAGTTKEMLTAQNMSGYDLDSKHIEAMDALRNGEDVLKVVKAYRKRQSRGQKLKRIILKGTGYMPAGLRAKLRKKNSSRYVRRQVKE